MSSLALVLLEAGWPVKTLLVGSWFGLLNVTASVDGQINLLLNVLTILFAVGVAIPALKSKRKDATIKDLNDALQAKDKRAEELEKDLRAASLQKRQLEQAAGHIKEDAAKAQAVAEELRRYTAQQAVEHFEEALSKHSHLVAERHQILITQGRETIAQGQETTKALASISETLACLVESVNRSTTTPQ